MSREIRRVPAGFDWPLREVWPGFLRPWWLREEKCSACDGDSYSPEGREVFQQWYGYAPFDPASTGSTPVTPETPAVRALAESNIASSPSFYGSGESAILREAQRLCGLWNGMLCHHLHQDDVDALVEAGRLMTFTHTWVSGSGWKRKDPVYRPTAAEVNEWSLVGMGHDSLNALVVIAARCERAGARAQCVRCDGHGSVEQFVGQRQVAENASYRVDPPSGEAWQIWETTTEGSPYSPAFDTRDELIAYLMSDSYSGFGTNPSPLTREQAEAFVDEGSSVGTFVSIDGRIVGGDAAVSELDNGGTATTYRCRDCGETWTWRNTPDGERGLADTQALHGGQLYPTDEGGNP